jgi:hypothetical protein
VTPEDAEIERLMHGIEGVVAWCDSGGSADQMEDEYAGDTSASLGYQDALAAVKIRLTSILGGEW